MNCKYCTAELEEKEKICRWCGTEITNDEEFALPECEADSQNDLIEKNADIDKQQKSNMIFRVIPTFGRIRGYTVTHKRLTTITAATLISIGALLMFLFLFIIPINMHKISECLIYMKGDSMYYTSLDKIKPTKMRDMTEIKEGMVDCLMVNNKLKMFSLLGNDLYRATSSGSSKIDSNVVAYYDNIEEDSVIYLTTDGTIYKNNGGNEKIKLADNASIIKVSKDLKTIYYLQKNELFMLKDNHDCVKIASNVKDVLQIYDDGELYYTVDNSLTAKRVDSSLPRSQVDNFIPTHRVDSSSSTDQVISSNKLNTELVRVETMNEELERDEYDEYQRNLMESVDSNGELDLIENENKVYNLYYYDGKVSKIISDKFISAVNVDADNAVIFFKALGEAQLYNQDQTSNLDNNGELIYKYNTALETEILMCKKDKSFLTSADSDCSNFKEYKGQYYYLRYENGNRYQLMCITPQEDGSDQRKTYIGVIDSYELLDNQVVYFRSINANTNGSSNGNTNGSSDDSINGNSDENFNDNITESNESTVNLLYLNYNIIDENVIGVQVDMNKLHNSFVYRKDYNQITGDYTLMIYQNGKKSKIADHVCEYTRCEDDSILYLINKDDDKESIDAYLYNSKGDNVLIDKNVTKFSVHNNFAVNTGMMD